MAIKYESIDYGELNGSAKCILYKEGEPLHFTDSIEVPATLETGWILVDYCYVLEGEGQNHRQEFANHLVAHIGSGSPLIFHETDSEGIQQARKNSLVLTRK